MPDFEREERCVQMHRWDPQMIRWMCEAMDYGSYNRDLAACIQPYLGKDDHVCEAGCGLGFLSLELAGHVRKISAFDRNADALAVLRERIQEHGLRNIETQCSTLEAFQTAETPDAMLFCLFGMLDEMIASAERLRCGKVITVHRRQSDELWRSKVRDFCGIGDLRGWQIVDRNSMDIPLNQPFRDLNDARQFMDMYVPEEAERCLTDDAFESVLRMIDHPVYRFELPVTRRLEMLVLVRK